VKKRRLPFNAAAHIELPEYTSPEVRPWSLAETGLFLEVTQGERLAALYELTMLEGLRRGECCGLRWDDVVLERCSACRGELADAPCLVCDGLGFTGGILYIRQQRVDVAGHIFEGAPKTRSGVRIIELGRRSLEVLLGWRLLQETEAGAWGEAWTTSGYVFTTEDGHPLRPEMVSREFKRLTALAGLRPLRLHDLRHLSASLQLAAGVELPIVSKRLGHSSIRITSDLYSHLLPGVGRAASDAAAALIPRNHLRLVEPPSNGRDHHVTTM
jgi:integrase